MSPLYGPSAAADTLHAGDAEADAAYLGDELLFTRPALPQISSFTVAPEHLRQGVARPSGIVLAGLVTGARTFRVERADGTLIATSGAQWTVAPAPASDTAYRFVAENREGTVSQLRTFYRSLPVAVTLRSLGSRQSPQPFGGVVITYTLRASVTPGHPGLVQLTWRGGGTTTVAMQRRYDRQNMAAATEQAARTWEFQIARTMTGRASTQTYTLEARNMFDTETASVTLQWA